MTVAGWGIPGATGRGKLHWVSFPSSPSQVKDLCLFLIVMQQIMCRLLEITEKLLLAPIHRARFLWSKGLCLQLVRSGCSLNTLFCDLNYRGKKMHNFQTWFKAYLNYILGVFPLPSVTSESEILHLLIVQSWFLFSDNKVSGFFVWFSKTSFLIITFQ